MLEAPLAPFLHPAHAICPSAHNSVCLAFSSFSLPPNTYANGFVVEMIQLADKIIFETNRELVDNGNGKFTAPDK